MTEVEFHATFKNFVIAHKQIGYKTTWVDKENYKYNNEVHYELNVPSKSGDLYFMVQSYFEGMVQKVDCLVDGINYINNGIIPQVTIKVSKGVWPDIDNKNTEVAKLTYVDDYNIPLVIKNDQYEADTNFVISVKYDWKVYATLEPPATPDYSLVLYSEHKNLIMK